MARAPAGGKPPKSLSQTTEKKAERSRWGSTAPAGVVAQVAAGPAEAPAEERMKLPARVAARPTERTG